MKGLIVMFISVFLLIVACSSNNPYFNWIPGISPDYSAGICDQDRTKVCDMFGDLDAVYTIVSGYMVFKMDKEESLGIIADARKYTRPGVLSGELMKAIVGDSERAKKLSYLAYKLGFNIPDAVNSTYIFDEASCETLNKYYDKLEWEINTFASLPQHIKVAAEKYYNKHNG